MEATVAAEEAAGLWEITTLGCRRHLGQIQGRRTSAGGRPNTLIIGSDDTTHGSEEVRS